MCRVPGLNGGRETARSGEQTTHRFEAIQLTNNSVRSFTDAVKLLEFGHQTTAAQLKASELLNVKSGMHKSYLPHLFRELALGDR